MLWDHVFQNFQRFWTEIAETFQKDEILESQHVPNFTLHGKEISMYSIGKQDFFKCQLFQWNFQISCKKLAQLILTFKPFDSCLPNWTTSTASISHKCKSLPPSTQARMRWMKPLLDGAMMNVCWYSSLLMKFFSPWTADHYFACCCCVICRMQSMIIMKKDRDSVTYFLALFWR